MSVLEYIVISLALTIPLLVTVCEGARKTPIRLTRGLLASFVISLEHVLCILSGVALGNLFSSPDNVDYNSMVYMGVMVLVAIWMLFPLFRSKSKESPAYDLSRWVTVILLGVATGMKSLMVGVAIGYMQPLRAEVWKLSVPLVVLMFLGSYFGLMLGRRKKEFHARRWQLIAVLFLLVFAFKGALWGE